MIVFKNVNPRYLSIYQRFHKMSGTDDWPIGKIFYRDDNTGDDVSVQIDTGGVGLSASDIGSIYGKVDILARKNEH